MDKLSTEPVDDLRETVRARYAAAAGQVAAGTGFCGSKLTLADQTGEQVFGDALYAHEQTEGAEAAIAGSLGCRVPTAVADLHERRDRARPRLRRRWRRPDQRSPRGCHRQGDRLDMTDEMLGLARANAANADVRNVEFLKGYIEQIPLPDEVSTS